MEGLLSKFYGICAGKNCLQKCLISGITDSMFHLCRYVNQGGDTALQENEARLKELAGRADKLKREKEAVSSEIDKLKDDIAKQQVSVSLAQLTSLPFQSG